MIVLKINPDKIKDVIGPGGKIINKIIADTGVKIDIENDGTVFIASPDGRAAKRAKYVETSPKKSSRRNLPRHGDARHRSVRSSRFFPARKASSTSANSRPNASRRSKTWSRSAIRAWSK